MPERHDHQLAADAALLSAWLKSEYYPAWERVMDDALEDAKNRVLNAPVTSQTDFYAVLEAKGRFMGLHDAANLAANRIREGDKARARLRGER